MSASASRRHLSDAVTALHRLLRSPKLGTMNREEAGFDLNPAALEVLQLIAQHGPLDLSRLSRVASLAPNALSRQVKLLETDGYITRETHPGDRRVSVVAPTADGAELVLRVRAANERMLARQLEAWSGAEIEQLAQQIDRLVADLRRSAGSTDASDTTDPSRRLAS